MQLTNPTIYSCFSSGPENHQINDQIERGLVIAETTLSGYGRTWGISLLSGTGRILFGAVEIIASIVYALFKILEMFFNRLAYGYDQAILSLNESLRSLLYIPHGIGNMGRGALEILQLCALTRTRNQFLPYPTHQARLAHQETLSAIPLREEEAELSVMQPQVNDDEIDPTS